MRIAIAVLFVSTSARADVIVGGAVGAGGQGAATYGALEARLDGDWRDVRFGLGARGVWLDGELRTSDYAGWRALRVVRLIEAHRDGLAIAAGGLAPAQLGHVADGYRATLDDRPRTGVRAAIATKRVAIGLEIDDVVEPHLIGSALEVALGERWIACAAGAIDPSGEVIGAVETCAARRWARAGARLDAGAGVVGERLSDGSGIAALGFVRGALDVRGARWTAETEVRAGSSGALFGPLHRIEEHRDEQGVGVAASIGVAGTRGWLHAGVRHRPGLGALATLSAGAPAGRWFQVAGWIAAVDRISAPRCGAARPGDAGACDHTSAPRCGAAACGRDAAGAAELRITWANGLASALEIARIYDVDAMEPAPRWTATVWFAIQRARRKP